MTARRRPLLLRLAPLAAAVLGLHLLLLGAPTPTLHLGGTQSVRPLIARAIEAPPAAIAPAPPVVTAPPPAPAPAPRSAPAQEARPAEPPAAAPPPPAVEPTPPPIAPTTAVPPRSVRGLDLTALAIPAPVRVQYEVAFGGRGGEASGSATLTWRHSGTDYEAELEVRAPAQPPRVQRSAGRLNHEGLTPLRFAERGRGPEQATHFQRDKGVISFSNNQPDAPLATGAQDRLSVLIQLSVLIGGDPTRYPLGTRIAVPVAGTRELDTWVFEVAGEEDLTLPGGAQRALRLVRTPQREFDVGVELWLAPRLGHAPVRLRVTQPNGDTVDQRWVSAEPA